MSGSINKVILIGNVGKDPEIRKTQGGDSIANLSIATSESWKDKSSGEKKEKTEWHRVVSFNDGLSGVIEKYVTKGSKIYVEGELRTRKWTDKDGVERYVTEVVLQKFGGKLVLLSGQPSAGGAQQGQTRQAARPAAGAFNQDEMDDEIPF